MRIISFESRRASEMQSLIARHGGVGTSAPAMREVPLDVAPAALELLSRLQAGEVAVLILLTGVGTQALQRAVASAPADRAVDEQAFIDLLRGTRLLVRGPKPIAVLKKWGLQPDLVAPAPNTWREVIAVLDKEMGDLSNRLCAVQEYGVPSQKLYDALAQRGARVLAVPVYRWMPPEDDQPLRVGLHGVVDGAFDAALFTSGNQVYSVFAAARDEGLENEFQAALHRMVIGSIGPVCSEALSAHGIEVTVEPTVSRMGQLVREVIDRGTAGPKVPSPDT